LHHPFGHLKHKLWSKEVPGVKLTIWLSIIKSRKLPWFLCMQVVCHISLESSWQGLQLCLDLISIEGFHTKLWAFKVVGIRTLGISGLSLGSPGTKCHLNASLVARHRVYYKGEGGGLPQIQAMVSFVSPSLFMTRPCTKSASTVH
jgi:hypothetical protein